MSLFSVSLLLVGFIAVVMLITSLVLKSRSMLVGSYSSSFECGFSAIYDKEMKVSIRFYNMLVVFLLMDVEVVFLFFMPHISLLGGSMVYGVVLVVLSIYFIGLMYELLVGGLSWSE